MMSSAQNNIIRKIISFITAGAALTAAFYGQFFMYVRKMPVQGTVYFCAAIILSFVFAAVSRAVTEESSVSKKTETAGFVIIVLIAVFFRFYMLPDMPSGLYGDEAQNGNESIKLMEGKLVEGTALPVFIGSDTSTNAAVYNYMIAAFLKIFGIEALSIRLVSAVLGTIACAAFYFMVRAAGGAQLALIASLLMASMRWQVNFSRIGFHATLGILAMILFLYFFIRMLKEKKTSDFILAGSALALTQYTYVANRLVPVTVFLVLVFAALKERAFILQNLRKLLIFGAVASVLYLPMLGYVIKNNEKFNERSRMVSVLTPDAMKNFNKPGGALDIVSRQAVVTLRMFNLYGDYNGRHNLPGMPMLDYVSGALFVCGFGMLLYRIFSVTGFLFIVSFFIYIIPSIITIECPQALRAVLAAPFAVIFTAVAIKGFSDILPRKPAMAVIIAVCAAVVFLNYDNYFKKQAKDPVVWASFCADERIIYDYIISKDSNWQFIIEPMALKGTTFRFYKNKLKEVNYSPYLDGMSVPAFGFSGKNVAYYLPVEFKEILPSLKWLYPEGKYVPFINPNNNAEYFFGYEVSADEVAKKENLRGKVGLTGYYYEGREMKGTPKYIKNDPFVYFLWRVPPIERDFCVQWSGKIKIDKTGYYSFLTESNDRSGVSIDGIDVFRERVAPTPGRVKLTAGLHKIKVDYVNTTGFCRVKLKWIRHVDSVAAAPEVVPAGVLIP